MEGFIACFEGLEDPRTGNAGRHDLLEILMIAHKMGFKIREAPVKWINDPGSKVSTLSGMKETTSAPKPLAPK